MLLNLNIHYFFNNNGRLQRFMKVMFVWLWQLVQVFYMWVFYTCFLEEQFNPFRQTSLTQWTDIWILCDNLQVIGKNVMNVKAMLPDSDNSYHIVWSSCLAAAPFVHLAEGDLSVSTETTLSSLLQHLRPLFTFRVSLLPVSQTGSCCLLYLTSLRQ